VTSAALLCGAIFFPSENCYNEQGNPRGGSNSLEREYLLTDKLQEECGVFGIHKVKDAARLAYYGLHSLQHRGQEAAGIAVSDGKVIACVKDAGLVSEVFNREIIDSLSGEYALGHVRYAVNSSNIRENYQPVMVRAHQGEFAVVHNGQIVNAAELRQELEEKGSIFQGTVDTEIIAHLIQRGEGTFIDKLMGACRLLEGAFSLIVMTKNTMYAARDPYGFRPLSLGRIDDGYVISSETCAFEIVNAHSVRDIEPGEIVKLGKDGYESLRYAPVQRKHMCAMEYVYFSRPDSDIEGKNVHAVRKEAGRVLARVDDVEADIVVGVPDSSISSAMGYAEERQMPYEMGLIKNKYVGRTFIRPTQAERERGVKMKLSAVKSIVNGKRIVLIDDSIVRGTTSRRIVSLLKDAGAVEVHVRIGSASLTSPCFYGVDMKTKEELISSGATVEEVRRKIGADSLRFMTIAEMKRVFGEETCTGCFDGRYVTDLFSFQRLVDPVEGAEEEK
jgi:amidophosphoribosyltransferase